MKTSKERIQRAMDRMFDHSFRMGERDVEDDYREFFIECNDGPVYRLRVKHEYVTPDVWSQIEQNLLSSGMLWWKKGLETNWFTNDKQAKV